MPPFGADAPLTPEGGKHLSAVSLWKAEWKAEWKAGLFIMHFSSFSRWGKDVRRTGWGLFK